MADQHPRRRYKSLSYAEGLASKHKAIGTLHGSPQTYAHEPQFNSAHNTPTEKPVHSPWTFSEAKPKKSPIDQTQLPMHGGIQTREGQTYWTGRFIAVSDRLRQSQPGLSDDDREDAVLQELWCLCISRAAQDSFRDYARKQSRYKKLRSRLEK